MLKGRIGRLYWGRCLIHVHGLRNRRAYAWRNHYSAGLCVRGRYVEWNR